MVISRGAQPPIFLYQFCFASNVSYGIAMMNFLTTIWLLRSFRCWLYNVTIRLKHHISIFKNMGVAANGPHPLSDIAPRDSLLKVLEITPGRFLIRKRVIMQIKDEVTFWTLVLL